MSVDFYKKSQYSIYNKKSIFRAEYQPSLNNMIQKQLGMKPFQIQNRKPNIQT